MGAVDKRIFTKGIDSDTTPELVGDGWYINAKNLNVVVSDGAHYGTAEVALGNTAYTVSLPSGSNKCIGSYEDKAANTLYFFNFNSNGQHGIYRIKSDTQQVETVLVDPLLNFSRAFLINHVDVAYLEPDRPILGWTDGGAPNSISPTVLRNPPRQIDVNKAIAYTNGDFVNGYTSITSEVLDQIKWQPTFSPVVAIANDPTYNRNNLTQKLFQFAYQYQYFDFSLSALSDYSEVVTPKNDEVLGNEVNIPIYLNNRIDVTLKRGSDICTKIKIYARIQNSTNSDWYLVDTIDNPTTPTVTYQFFNDKELQPVEINEATKLFDDVPLVAKCEAIVAGNRKVWSNVINQFNLPTPDISLLNQSINLPDIPDGVVAMTAVQNCLGPFPFFNYEGTVFTLPTLTEMTIYLRFILSENQLGAKKYIYYTIQPEDYTSVSVFANNVIDFLTFYGVTQLANSGVYSINGIAQPLAPNQIFSAQLEINLGFQIFPNISIEYPPDINNAVISTAKKISAWKSGATHVFGLEYADFAGRFCSTITDNQFNHYVPFATETLSTQPYIKQNQIISAINHQPPIWASSYRWKYGGSKIASFIQFSIRSASTSGTKTTLSLAPIGDYSTAYPNSIITYSYTSGDRCRIISNQNSVLFTQYVDVPVTGYDEGTFALTVDAIQEVGVTLAAGDLIEIYTPKPDLSAQEVFFYTVCSQEFEIGDAGLPSRYHKGGVQDQDIANNIPAVSIMERGDIWLRPRQMATTNATTLKKYWVEDFNFSDFYNSVVYDKGKPNIFDPNYRETERPTTTYYSQPFIPETNINGLGSVFPNSFGSDDIRILLNYGSIQKIYSEGVQLYIFQETKTGVVRVNERVAFDAANNNIVGATDNVLNPINYYAGDYGIGKHPESFAWYGYAKYHVDVRRGVVLRLSTDGYTPISSIYKVNNFTTDRFAEIFNSGVNVNIYGVYNPRFNRYEYSVEPTEVRLKPSIQGYTFAFSENSNSWTSFYDYLPDYMGSLGQELITFKNGTPYLHNSGTEYAKYYGVQYRGELQMVFNDQPSESKLYNTIAIEGTTAWDAPVIEVFNGSQTQRSNLVIDDFEQYEGKFRAWFLMDVLTPNVANPLINGDNLRGRYIKVTLFAPQGYSRIFAVDVDVISSAINRL